MKPVFQIQRRQQKLRPSHIVGNQNEITRVTCISIETGGRVHGAPGLFQRICQKIVSTLDTLFLFLLCFPSFKSIFSHHVWPSCSCHSNAQILCLLWSLSFQYEFSCINWLPFFLGKSYTFLFFILICQVQTPFSKLGHQLWLWKFAYLSADVY